MYKKILAPLDGSELGDCALAHVRAIASGCQVPEVVLFGVVEPIYSSQIASELGQNWLRDAARGMRAANEDYLAKAAAKLQKEGINARTVVTEGTAADEILKYASKNKVDLIIMSSHGRSGPTRWAFGSVADRVVRHATVPVLVAAAPACRAD